MSSAYCCGSTHAIFNAHKSYAHKKSHTGLSLVPKLVTLNDLELHSGRDFALFHQNLDIGD